MADIATALMAAGKEKEGEQMWRDLVKWNPRAPQKDQALAALGMQEMKRGDEKKALEYFDRFEKETMGSLLFGKIMLAKTDLLALRGQNEDARKTLDSLLANKYSQGGDKAQALYRIGEMHMKENNPKLAVPYYQRIYVMYGRWRDWVAKAYLRSGEAFEKMQDKDAARRSYQELTENETMADLQEYKTARERLQALGGPLPKAQPTPAQG
jgi:tetratricopeptide (TPR) repeat protein